MSGYHGENASSRISPQQQAVPKPFSFPELSFNLDDLKEVLRDGVHTLCTAAGLVVLNQMMEEDVKALAGAKGKHDANAIGYRHGTEPTSIVLSGQKVAINRRRVRKKDRSSELPIETYEIAKQDDQLLEAVLARILYGLSSRNYRQVQEPLPEDVHHHGTSKSSVSRRFVQATEEELKKSLGRRLEELDIRVLLLDGVEFADAAVVALGIDHSGTKHVLGLKLGATENATVCKNLLADLMDRGLSDDEGLLAIIAGPKRCAAL